MEAQPEGLQGHQSPRHRQSQKEAVFFGTIAWGRFKKC